MFVNVAHVTVFLNDTILVVALNKPSVSLEEELLTNIILNRIIVEVDLVLIELEVKCVLFGCFSFVSKFDLKVI